MRGTIIHYNAVEGRGLIASEDQQQFPFEISQWRSSVAPNTNQTVELALAGGGIATVSQVSDEALLREKATEIAGKLGTAGTAALKSLKDASPSQGASASGLVKRLGKVLIAAHGLFVFGAVFLAYIEITNPMLGGSSAFSLISLSELSQQMGASVGGGMLAWMAIFSIAVPAFWRNRWAWLALLLPLVASVKPLLDLKAAVSEASASLGGAFGSQLADQLLDMIGFGSGLVLCIASAIVIALIGTRRLMGRNA